MIKYLIQVEGSRSEGCWSFLFFSSAASSHAGSIAKIRRPTGRHLSRLWYGYAPSAFLAADAERLLLYRLDARFFLGPTGFKASAARSASFLASRKSRSLAVLKALAFASD